MAFLDIRFPVRISFGAVGGPGFLTDVVITNGGAESRDQIWAYERGSWEVSHAARMPDMYRKLQAFFRAVGGRANTFRFKDWTDFSATAAEGRFIAITGSDELQMVKRYTFGAYTFDRKIVLPISGTVTVTGGSGVSVDYSDGTVSCDSNGEPTAWAGEFDILARFDTDRMHAETIDRSGPDLIIGWSSIPVVEVRG